MMDTEPLIRVTVCVNRKKGTTEEEFNKYWAYEHGPLALDWLLRCGIVRYVQVGDPQRLKNTRINVMLHILTLPQYHTTSEYRDLAKKMSEAVGRPGLQYDGMGDFWVRKYEDFEAAFLDKEYQEKIRPDELRLIDMDTVAVTVGVEYVAIDDGKIVTEHSRSF